MFPSYTWGLWFPLLRSEVGPGASGAAPEWDHLLIDLHYTGRADTSRFKRDANLPRGETWAGSTCHDGLLAAVMGAPSGASPSGAGLLEIRPHSRVVVVRVEYSSRTLAPCLPLCRKCKDPSLRGTFLCWHEGFLIYNSCLEPLPYGSGKEGTCSHFFQERRLLDFVEAAGDICVQHVSWL